MSSSDLNIEQLLKTLEKTVSTMENMENIEKALKAYEEGIQLVRRCQKALQNAEQKVRILSEKNETFHLDNYIENNQE